MDLHSGLYTQTDRLPRSPLPVPGKPLPFLTVAALLMGALPATAQLSVEVSPLRVELQSGPAAIRRRPSRSTTAAPRRCESARASATGISRATERRNSKGPGGRSVLGNELGPRRAAGTGDRSRQGRDRPVHLTVPPVSHQPGTAPASSSEFLPASGDPVARKREIQFSSRMATLIYVNVGKPPATVELIDLRAALARKQTQVVAPEEHREAQRPDEGHRDHVWRGKPRPRGPGARRAGSPESEREVAIVASDRAAIPYRPAPTASSSRSTSAWPRSCRRDDPQGRQIADAPGSCGDSRFRPVVCGGIRPMRSRVRFRSQARPTRSRLVPHRRVENRLDPDSA